MEAATTQANLTIPEAMRRANAHWNAGQADQAEILCQRVLAAWPGHSDALHLLGLMAHAYGNLDLAITHLESACQSPRAPAPYVSNLAELLRRKGRLADAEAAARRSVNMDPQLVAGWSNLGIVLQESGKLDESLKVLEWVIALRPDWAEAHNNLGNTNRRLGRLHVAEGLYSRALSLNPGYAEACSNLAYLLTSRGQFEEAAAMGRRAIELNPRLTDAYLNLADVEIARHRHQHALKVLDSLHGFAPRLPAALVARAIALRHIERFDLALECARAAVSMAPQSASARNVLALSLQSLGLVEEALEHFEQAAALPGTVAEDAMLGAGTLLLEAGRKEEALAVFDRTLAAFPTSVRTLIGRADAKTFAAGDPDLDAMEALVAEGDRRPLADRISAQFALGKAYLDIKDAARAFTHFAQANAAKRATFSYDALATAAWMQRVADTLHPGLFERLRGAGAQSELPVFVIGMPRSGTTLIEQILASHSQVTGAGELSALRLSVEESGTYPDMVRTLHHEDITRIGERYLARVQPLAQGRRHVVDKMPGNFMFAGLIPLILPGARIVHCRRDPIDTCLSCYTKNFGGVQPFAYDQTELGQFYRAYEQLMAHWRNALPPTQFIEVDYEAVVDDLEGEAQRLVGFLGLPWEESCLNFHSNSRVVRTASMIQVRQPIYRTSKGRWQAHAEHLAPLLAALGVSTC